MRSPARSLSLPVVQGLDHNDWTTGPLIRSAPTAPTVTGWLSAAIVRGRKLVVSCEGGPCEGGSQLQSPAVVGG